MAHILRKLRLLAATSLSLACSHGGTLTEGTSSASSSSSTEGGTAATLGGSTATPASSTAASAPQVSSLGGASMGHSSMGHSSMSAMHASSLQTPSSSGGLEVATTACDGAILDTQGVCRGPERATLAAECCAPYDCDPAHLRCDAVPPQCPPGSSLSMASVACWGPCVPTPLCAVSPEALCHNTGGVWDLNACGDYTCGVRGLCYAAFPGCNCGHNANFVAGRGCVAASCAAQLGEPCGEWDAVGSTACTTGLVCVFHNSTQPTVGVCQPDPAFVCNDSNVCPAWTQCCYPCGTQGCHFTCAVANGSPCPALP